MSQELISNKALVSVIIPTFNSEKNIRSCLNSIKNQTYKNIEIIVVDQYSNDLTRKIAEQMGCIVLLTSRSRVYAPPTASRNLGSKHARGAFLFQIDSDMELTQQVIEECVKLCENGADAVIVPELDIGEGFLAKCKALERMCYINSPAIEAARFFRKDAFDAIKGYDEGLGSGEDWDIHLRLKSTGLKVVRINHYIRHRISHISLKNQVRKKFAYGITFYNYFKKYPGQFESAVSYYKLAYLGNLKVLLKDPLHLTGMIFLRFCEIFAVSIGMLASTIGSRELEEPQQRTSPRQIARTVQLQQLQITPSISVIIPTLNSDELLRKCLASLAFQNYPKDKIEIIIVDGGSTDATIDTAKLYDARIIQDITERDNPEGRKAIGIMHAKNELLLFIDSDNILPHKDWIKNMILPIISDGVVATQPIRYHYDESYSKMNRYFALVGIGDPVVYYLGKSDHLSWADDISRYPGKIHDTGPYYQISFNPYNMPTLGANGFMIRKDILMRSNCKPSEYFHIDVNLDLVKLGYNTYGIVKDDIIHLSFGSKDSIANYIIKRLKYMRKYYGQQLRRYMIYSSKRSEDRLKLAKFILYSITLIKPVHDSIRGYKKVPDSAWFLHPIMCIAILFAYGIFETIIYLFWRKLKSFWS